MLITPISQLVDQPGSGITSLQGWQNPAWNSGNGYGMSFSSTGSTMPRITPPGLQQFNYSQDSNDYPTILKSIGENQAQQSFQSAVNNGVRLGNSVQGYQHAQDTLNQNRLAYMGNAANAQFGLDKAKADLASQRNDELLRMYGLQIGERGQDIGLAGSMYGRGGGGSGWTTIGGGRSNPGYGGSTYGGGNVDIYGRGMGRTPDYQLGIPDNSGWQGYSNWNGDGGAPNSFTSGF